MDYVECFKEANQMWPIVMANWSPSGVISANDQVHVVRLANGSVFKLLAEDIRELSARGFQPWFQCA